jgi:hypothetical protein
MFAVSQLYMIVYSDVELARNEKIMKVLWWFVDLYLFLVLHSDCFLPDE